MQKRDHFRRLQKKQYSTGTYRNPYFKDKKDKPSKKLILVGAVSFFLFILLIFLFSYRGLAIRHVSIIGLQPSAHQEFEKQTNAYFNRSHFLFFHNTNRFLFSDKQLQETLSTLFSFEEMHINVSRDTVVIELKERASQFIWKTNSDTYLVDFAGTLIQKVDLAQAPPALIQPSKNIPMPIFVDRNNTTVSVGEHILSSSEIQNIFTFVQQISNQGIFVKEVQIDQLAGKWRGVLTRQGYTILFDPSTDVTTQSNKLKTLLSNTLKDTSHLNYIDLRFGDHVYYK